MIIAFPGGLREPYTRFQSFLPVTQTAPQYLTIYLRTSSSPESITNTLRNVVAELILICRSNRIRTARTAV
jgi:hypothetical protein